MSAATACPRRPVTRWVFGLLALGLAAVLAFTACSPVGERRPEVVVTTNILGDITRNLLGDQATVTVLMKPDADPHSFAISARQAARLQNAALVVYNGLGLEEGVLRNVDAAREAGVATLGVGDHVDPIRYVHDDLAGRPDPHFWTDPQRVATAVDVIAERAIREVDGVDADAVRANAAAYREQLHQLDATMRRQFGSIPQGRRNLVTNHHVFGYLAERYGFRVVGAVIPSGTTLASPSASDLKSLADAIRTADVPAIFVDSSQPDRLAQVLVSETGLRVRVIELFTESLSTRTPGATTYVEMMRSNSAAIVRGLTAR